MSKVNDAHVEEALRGLEATLRHNEKDAIKLHMRILEARDHHRSGRGWDEILEVDGSVVQLVTGMYVRLGEVSGPLQRSLVTAMRADGVSIPRISRLFGVTHQRISNILARIEKGKKRKPRA